MFNELETLKTWGATVATKAEASHLDRRLNFVDIQISGTNEKLNAIETKVDRVSAGGGPSGDTNATGGSTCNAGGATGKAPCSGIGMEHANLIKLLASRVSTLEASRATWDNPYGGAGGGGMGPA